MGEAQKTTMVDIVDNGDDGDDEVPVCTCTPETSKTAAGATADASSSATAKKDSSEQHQQHQQQQQQQSTQHSSTATDTDTDTATATATDNARNHTPDTRDEEDIEDPYVYSDDSASLSDAYFFPQSDDELGKPYRQYYREDDPLKPSDGSAAATGASAYPTTSAVSAIHHQYYYPVASYYGSLNGIGGNAGAGGAERSASPLWVGGSIQEDAELQSPLVSQEDLASNSAASATTQQAVITAAAAATTTTTTTTLTWKEQRKRQRKQQRRLQQKQRERISRERAVAHIRGKPQDRTQWKDPIFAILFVVQLLAIFVCALRFGYVLFRTNPHWLHHMFPKNHTTTSTELLFHHAPQQQQQHYLQPQQQQQQHSLIAAALVKPSADTMGTSSSNGGNSDNDSMDSTFTNDDDTISSSSSSSFAFTIDYKNIISLVTVAGFYACVLTYLSFGFMLILARALIQIMLVFSVLLALAWGVIGLTLDPYGVISIMGFTSLLLTLGYAIASWSRIPFAATNLHTALCAMRCTADITILGLMSLLVAFGWCIVWTMAVVGLVNSFNSAECTKNYDDCQPHMTSGHIPLYLVLLFSFHWTNTVIKNVVRVTVASAIGTWWLEPTQVGPFCTNAVIRPLIQSLTKSLGSICLGSLVVQPACMMSCTSKCCCYLFGFHEKGCLSSSGSGATTAAIAATSNQKGLALAVGSAAEEESGTDCAGLCTNFCGLHRCREYLRPCNRWAFTYIGMYGYGFSEAGERALKLFETREWVEVVKDNLIQNVLLMASVIIGGSTGTFAVVVEETDGYDFTSFHKPIFSAFLVGSVIGYVLSNILLLGVVASAVNTVLVCFAANPFDFDKNHSRLSREMREVWSQQVFE